jgi:tetratricopeptide (TPR) repeat protein
MGIELAHSGRSFDALDLFSQALEIYRQIETKKEEADSLTNIGNVYLHLGQYQKALQHYEQVLAIHKQIGDKQGEGIALGNIGIVYSDLGQYEEALISLRQALAIYENIGIPTEIIEGNIGDILLIQGNIEEASRIFKKLNAPIRLGRISLLKKEYSDTLVYFQKFLERVVTTKNTDLLFATYMGLGQSYEGLGHSHNSIKFYKVAKKNYLEAVELLEKIRDSLLPGQRIRFFESKTFGFSRLDPYEGLVRILEHLQGHNSSLLYTEYIKARYFSEAFAARQKGLTFHLPEKLASSEQAMELVIAALYQQKEKAFKENRMEAYERIDNLLKEKKEEKNRLISKIRKDHPEYASLKYPQPLKPSEIPLKPDEYLLEYEVTDTEVFAWLIHDGKVIKTQKIPITKELLIKLVALYRSYFQTTKKGKIDLTRFDPKTGNRLYQLLLEKILLQVPQKQHLIIVPDEILGILPFEALVVKISKGYRIKKGREGPIPYGIRYVADELSISYYQSATSLATIRNLRQKSKAKRPMLALVDPVFDEEKRVAKKVHENTKLAKVYPISEDDYDGPGRGVQLPQTG